MKSYIFKGVLLIDTSTFVQNVEHATRNGSKESTGCRAIKIDNADGLANHLGFNSSMLSLVDFYCYSNHLIQLIELTDLEDSIIECNLKYQEEVRIAEDNNNNERLTSAQTKKIRKQVWKSVLLEFKGKWCGSIAVIERLYRKNKIHENNPDYKLLIICKNSTDILMLDILKNQLSGMMGGVNICNSKSAENLIVSV